jgi:hypothetical protein
MSNTRPRPTLVIIFLFCFQAPCPHAHYCVVVQVDGKPVTPEWTAKQEQPKCDSKATVVDSKTIKFTWATTATSTPAKWGSGL